MISRPPVTDAKHQGLQHKALGDLCRLVDAMQKRPPDLSSDLVLRELTILAALPPALCMRVRHALNAKIKALELLGRHLRLWGDISENTLDVTFTLRLEHAIARLAQHQKELSLEDLDRN